MSSKRAVFGAGIALCALFICIGVALVVNTALATDNPKSTLPDANQTSIAATAVAEVEGDGESATATEGTEDQNLQELCALPLADGTSASQTPSTAEGNAAPSNPARIGTISINCTTALDHADSLASGILQKLPANGYLLAPSQIEITEGASAFDTLKQACLMAGIPIDYSEGPFGGSAYVRSIGPIGEFDCGPESGWTFTVNGQMIFSSASDYKMQPGDVLVWSYSCGLN